ncbi:MAG: hypothetical protein JSV18_04045 [Candidatus Bathyarchaeota archaeon]|nr:MAG: hypothetical protein JSV18_04045 [Candidatus Bathyarchaeota archaeon]
MNLPKRSPLILIAIIIASTLPHAVGQPYYEPSELSFRVYPDGYVVVEYDVDVDPTRSRVNVTLFGSLYLHLLVEDQDGLILDHSSIEGGLSIDTLGAISVFVFYETTDLTGKEGQIWTFMASAPTSCTVTLPEDSSIISLSAIPLAMSIIDGALILTMPEGDLEVAYTIGVVGTREHALAVIRDSEDLIQMVQAGGVTTTEADVLLQQARDAFEAELYGDAELLAEQAKNSALSVQAAALSATDAISDAQTSISAADEAGRTVGLDTAQELLQQAEDAFDQGDYETAQSLAEQAQSAAAGATLPERGGGLEIVLTAALAVAAIAAVAFFFLRRKEPEPSLPAVSFDLEALFEEHPYLRLDDKEVIRFLAESGGETFAAEIRERFDVPRTSLWRMIRRLQREGVVEVSTIGGQSLVKISQKYSKGGPEE